jgi:hypothetical protein
MRNALFATLVLLPGLWSCESEPLHQAAVSRTGFIQDGAISEASGIQAARRNPGTWFVHNDDGQPVIYALDGRGRDQGSFRIDNARNRDWEDITVANAPEGPLLVVGDLGDNDAGRKSITLYFVAEPEPAPDGRYSGTVELRHQIRLAYPDGPRDCESLAYDPVRDDLLLISKRDQPARLYGIPLDTALAEDRAVLRFLGEIQAPRPSATGDALRFGFRNGRWASQPTGFDIRADGRQAAIISYRSIYFYDRLGDESWGEALRRPPIEFRGPPGDKKEAIGYAADGGHLLVTSEGVAAPVYRVELVPPQPAPGS